MSVILNLKRHSGSESVDCCLSLEHFLSVFDYFCPKGLRCPTTFGVMAAKITLAWVCLGKNVYSFCY